MSTTPCVGAMSLVLQNSKLRLGFKTIEKKFFSANIEGGINCVYINKYCYKSIDGCP